MHHSLPVPRSWNHRVKSSVLSILALSQYCFTSVRGWAARTGSVHARLQAEIDHLKQEVALLQEEIRVKDSRMTRTPPHRRAHYDPTERMVILELRAARGLSAKQTADRFLVIPDTIASWLRRIDEGGPSALLRLREPVNKFPDLVRYIVHRLRLMCPRLGKVKIAEMLCRAGLHLTPTTVQRMLREDPIFPEPEEEAATSGPILKAHGPNHIWHVDLTTVPTNAGFWTSWVPCALPQQWPFCWWVAVVIDHFSRRVQGLMIFHDKPNSKSLRAFLGSAIRRVGSAPRHLICDKEQQFFCEGFRIWCRRWGIGVRYGATGKHGSIAVIERFILTMKNECSRRIAIPLRRERLRSELSLFTRWYNEHRPHTFLAVRTPDEVYRGLSPTCEQPRLELRPRWPRYSRCASPQAPVEEGKSATTRFQVSFLGGRRHLPVVSLQRAA